MPLDRATTAGLLICCAHPSEASCLQTGAPPLLTGVGKVASAVSLQAKILQRQREGDPVQLVLSFGFAGAYVRPGAPLLGACVWVGRDELLDEGAALANGFLSLQALDLLQGQPTHYQADADWMAKLAKAHPWPIVPGATVSSASAHDALQVQRIARSDAMVETMEGAAIAHVCHQLSIPWVNLRVISNRTGDRDRAGWDIALAQAKLCDALLQLFST